jgi:hypothetical protein
MKQRINKLYYELNQISPDSTAMEKRKRGRDFEKLLGLILDSEKLEPSTNYRPKGEEIDGSFILSEKVYLFEAKWHIDELPASSIYAFKGKVDGKLLGTIGLFISISGYSKDAVDALTLGKTLNVILFDKEDIEFCIQNSFRSGLRIKLRKAAEYGVVYYPLKSLSIEKNIATNLVESKQVDTKTESKKKIITIVCEGQTDKLIIQGFITKILEQIDSAPAHYVITVAQGKYSAPRLASEVLTYESPRHDYLVIVDGDNQLDKTFELFRKEGLDKSKIIIPNPSIEIWLGMEFEQKPIDFFRKNNIRKGDPVGISKLIMDIDIDDLSDREESFRNFREIITGHNNGSYATGV